ncbi:hypothetical protein Nepgr_029054 [Nepenthes gracilis]|uniref:Uncharacterized protein n=1 Tax=Nepenthes gracilis TaxID=150966 RepID=A0AAD3Y565_NEPGR|nr:hypothetical protein Nepgr_029054 [Nepenthes gracilis]
MKIQVSHLAFYLAVVAAAVVLLEEITLSSAQQGCVECPGGPGSAGFKVEALPSPAACAKLREQKPLLCAYLKNPKYKKYVGDARRIAGACHIPIKC